MKDKIFIMIWLSITLTLAVIGMVTSSILFTIGYHNMDLGHNMKYMNSEFNLNLMDLGSDFNLRTSSELYVLGVNQIFKGFGFMMFFNMLFITSLILLNMRGVGK